MVKPLILAALAATAMGAALNTTFTPVSHTPTTTPSVPLGTLREGAAHKHHAADSTTLPNPLATICEGDTSSLEGVEALQDNTGFAGYLDIMLNIFSQHETDWVNVLWKQQFPGDGATPFGGCGDIDGTCSWDTLCSNYLTPMAYWALQSVQVLHSKLTVVRSTLTYTGWIDSLSIDQIGEDFSVPSPDNSWMSIAASAFGFGGALDSPTGMMSTLASSLFWMLSSTAQSTMVIDTTSMQTTLRNTAKALGDGVTQMMKDATGNGDVNNLPVYVDSTLEHATARFYSQSGILVDENKDNSTFQIDFSTFISNLEKKLVTMGMYTAYYILVMDTDLHSAECTETGMLWLPWGSSNGCFYLSRPKSPDGCDVDDPRKCEVDEWQSYSSRFSNSFDFGIYSKITDTYSIDLNILYPSLIDCEMNGNGTVDNDNTVNGIPRCFYYLHVMSGNWGPSAGSTIWMELDDLKTLKST